MKLDIVLVPQSEVERIQAQLVQRGPIGCLFLPSGWGNVVVNSPRVVCVKIEGIWYQPYLHQLIYEWYSGPVPRGQVVRHLCGYGACGNRDHLAAGTQQKNRWDREFHRQYGAGVLAPLEYD